MNYYIHTNQDLEKGHSTDTCLFNLSDYIQSNISEGDYVGMVLWDLQKAFDTVNHAILFEKLRIMGVGYTDCFKSYFYNRKQIVTFNDIKSNPGLVTCGVPQGSILGP